jgi:uncharacterized protein
LQLTKQNVMYENSKVPIDDFLITAIQNKDIFNIKRIIASGIELNDYYEESSYLNFAIHYGNLEVIKTLVLGGADVNYLAEEVYEDMYPLSLAACLGELEIAKYLIENGANPNQFDAGSEDFPLLKAAKNGKIEMFNFLREITSSDLVEIALVEVGKFDTWRDRLHHERFPKLIDSVKISDLSRVKHFIDFEVNVNSFDEYHMTPLMYSVLKPPKSASSKVFKVRYRIIEALLEARANPNLIGRGISPLITAVSINDLEAIKLLLKFGADTELKDKTGYNAILKAEEMNGIDMLELLLAT